MEQIKLFIDICSIREELSLIKTIGSDGLKIEVSVFNLQNCWIEAGGYKTALPNWAQ